MLINIEETKKMGTFNRDDQREVFRVTPKSINRNKSKKSMSRQPGLDALSVLQHIIESNAEKSFGTTKLALS
jgi:hypothetical protein